MSNSDFKNYLSQHFNFENLFQMLRYACPEVPAEIEAFQSETFPFFKRTISDNPIVWNHLITGSSSDDTKRLSEGLAGQFQQNADIKLSFLIFYFSYYLKHDTYVTMLTNSIGSFLNDCSPEICISISANGRDSLSDSELDIIRQLQQLYQSLPIDSGNALSPMQIRILATVFACAFLTALFGEQTSVLDRFKNDLCLLREIPAIEDCSGLGFVESFSGIMFLHTECNQFLTLEHVYQESRFDIYGIEHSDKDSSHCLYDYLQSALQHIETKRPTPMSPSHPASRVLTIAGNPGSGKSSLIQYLVSTPKMLHLFYEKGLKKIRICRFADQRFLSVNWTQTDANTLVAELLHACGFGTDAFSQLNDTLLIIDGFDEIALNGSRDQLIKNISQVINNCIVPRKCFVIFTCRTHYLRKPDHSSNRIDLLPLDKEQVCNFCSTYNRVMQENKSWFETPIDRTQPYDVDTLRNFYDTQQNILGVPLLLYMIIASGVSLSTEGNESFSDKRDTITGIYNKLFDVNTGIFSHYTYKEHRNSTTPRIQEASPIPEDHRIGTLHVLKLIAIQMFLKDPDRASITESDFTVILNKVKASLERSDEFEEETLANGFLRNVLRLVDGSQDCTTDYNFVHRSMYEYFTALYLYDQMIQVQTVPSSDINITVLRTQPALQRLQSILQSRLLSPDIHNHLMYLLRNHLTARTKWTRIFQLLLQSRFSFLGSITDSVPEYTAKSAQEKTITFYAPMEDSYFCYQSENTTALIGSRHEAICFLNFMRIIRDFALLGADDSKLATVSLCTDSTKNLYEYYIRLLIHETLCCKQLKKDSEGQKDEADRTVSVYDAIIDTDLLDLSHLDLSGMNLKHLDLSHICFDYSHLTGANMEYASLRSSTFTGTTLDGATLHRSDFRKAVFSADSPASFKGSDLRNVDLQAVDLSKCRLTDCHLEDAMLYRGVLDGADLSGANLSGADFVYSKVRKTDFTGAILIRSNFEGADVTGAIWKDAEDCDANFSGTNKIE